MANSGGSHFAFLIVEVNRNALDVQRTVVKLDRVEGDLIKICAQQLRLEDHLRVLEVQCRVMANESQTVATTIRRLESTAQELTSARNGSVEMLKLLGIVFSIVVSSISLLKVFGLLRLPWPS